MKTITELKTPVHPGEFIRTEILEPYGLNVSSGARVLRVSRPALSNMLNGNADLSGDMALRIEKAFGVSMETLMRMQAAYNIAETRRRAGTIKVPRFRRAIDFSDLPESTPAQLRAAVAARGRRRATSTRGASAAS